MRTTGGRPAHGQTANTARPRHYTGRVTRSCVLGGLAVTGPSACRPAPVLEGPASRLPPPASRVPRPELVLAPRSFPPLLAAFLHSIRVGTLNYFANWADGAAAGRRAASRTGPCAGCARCRDPDAAVAGRDG